MASSVRRFVSMRPLGAIGESASWFGVVGVSGWTSGRVEFPVSQKPAKRIPRQLFTSVPAECIPAPSCNRDRSPDVDAGADNVLKTTRLVAFNFASTCSSTSAFLETVLIVSSSGSRMLNCRLSEEHLNRTTFELKSRAPGLMQEVFV